MQRFFQKSKGKCWEVMESDDKFSECFASIGSSRSMSDELGRIGMNWNEVEEFKYRIYSNKEESVKKIGKGTQVYPRVKQSFIFMHYDQTL